MTVAITRALAHFIWEGALIGAIAVAILRTRRSARTRYCVAALALLSMAVAFAVTLAISLPPRAVRFAPPARSILLPALPQDAGTPASDVALDRLSIPALVWMSGVLILYARSLTSWMLAERLRRVGVCAAPALWQQRLDELRRQIKLSKPVALLESCLAETPAVVGFFRPVILIPLGLLAGLPAEQVEAILLHELAHIRRYDYAVNLLLAVVEGLLFYHPAVWWLARVVRAEREDCCDDEVVAATGDRRGYASALASLEQYRWTQSQAAAMAVRGGNLMHRIRRILNVPEQPRSAGLPVFSVVVLIAAGALLAAAWQIPKRSELPRTAVQSAYEKWVNEDVVYIITDEERAAFDRLQTDEEREHFIEQFWIERDPTPGTPVNEMKEEHYRRIAYANDHFKTATLDGWKTGRGRMYIVYGPPDEIESHPAGGDGRGPFEQWLYRHIDGIGDQVLVDFADENSIGKFPVSAWVFQAGYDRRTFLSVPLEAGTYQIRGRVIPTNSKVDAIFEQTSTGPQVFTKSFALLPGAYVLQLMLTRDDGSAPVQRELGFTVR
jgi:GWxTD domain-containing protein